MKQAKLTLILVALTTLFLSPTPVKTSPKTAAKKADILYWWFTPDGTFTGRAQTLEWEALLTGYSAYKYNPYTVMEWGYSGGSVIVDKDGVAAVVYGSVPEAGMYTHP